MDYSDLMKLASGHVEARIVQVALELEIFETIGTHALEPGSVANWLALEPRATELMLNALTALGLLRKREDGFSLTDVSAKYLKRDAPGYLGSMIRFEASLWHCWTLLAEAIRSGRPVRAADMYQDNPKETTIFIDAMDSLVKARGDAEIMAEAFDWDNAHELLDVGSGPATYPIALCRRFSNLRATIFDLPATIALTECYVREAGLTSRIRLISGDYRVDELPGSYDVVFLSNIIHSESFEVNQRLMVNLSSVLKTGGSVIVKDHILDSTRINPPVGALFSLLMLLTTQAGRCYAFDEVEAWMSAAGLTHIRQIDLPAPLNSSLIIATKEEHVTNSC
jgi:O-methyltransferase domain/Dimerisation domain